MPRQKLTRPTINQAAPGFIAATPPPARDRTWETKHPTASYRIPIQTRDEITSIAADLLVTTSDLAAALLAHALAEYRAGRLKFTPRLKGGKYSL